MRIRAVAPAALGLILAAALTACSAVSESDAPASTPPVSGGTTSGTASPTTSTTSSPGGGQPGGSYKVPKSACDLVDAASLERISGRSGLSLRSVSTGSNLACAFTDGFLPVGAVTLVVREATAGKTAQQELDDTVAASTYGKDKVQDIPGLGAAARYGTSPSIGGLTFASIYVIDLRGNQVASLSISIDAKDPGTAKDPLVALARTALGKI